MGGFLRVLKKRFHNSGLKIFSGLARFLNTTQVETLTQRIQSSRIAPVHGDQAAKAPAERME